MDLCGSTSGALPEGCDDLALEDRDGTGGGPISGCVGGSASCGAGTKGACTAVLGCDLFLGAGLARISCCNGT